VKYRRKLTVFKLLGITCDNAKVNDSMLDELAELVLGFPGKPNQTRCFLHILNLVAKTIIKQFDVRKKKIDELNGEEDILDGLAAGIELEELEMQAMASDSNKEERDNVEGWIDEVALLSDEEKSQLNADMVPIHTVIVKASSTFRIYSVN
jgi:hypothetical protein